MHTYEKKHCDNLFTVRCVFQCDVGDIVKVGILFIDLWRLGNYYLLNKHMFNEKVYFDEEQIVIAQMLGWFFLITSSSQMFPSCFCLPI